MIAECADCLLLGRICCVVGLLLSTGGFAVASLGASVNLSAGAVETALGVLGYFLGARRLQPFSKRVNLSERGALSIQSVQKA
jgi:hypothetical protein